MVHAQVIINAQHPIKHWKRYLNGKKHIDLLVYQCSRTEEQNGLTQKYHKSSTGQTT